MTCQARPNFKRDRSYRKTWNFAEAHAQDGKNSPFRRKNCVQIIGQSSRCWQMCTRRCTLFVFFWPLCSSVPENTLCTLGSRSHTYGNLGIIEHSNFGKMSVFLKFSTFWWWVFLSFRARQNFFPTNCDIWQGTCGQIPKRFNLNRSANDIRVF